MPRPQKYDEKLYEDINRKMQGLDRSQKANFIIDLTVLAGLSDGEQEKAIDKSIEEYYVPRREDGTLDREVYEQHMEDLERARIDRIYRPLGEFALQNQQEHSEKWIWDQGNMNTQMGIYQTGHMLQILGLQQNEEAKDALGEAFPEAESRNRIIEQTLTRKRQQILESFPEEERRKVQEALRYTGDPRLMEENRTPEQQEEQRQKESRDTFMDDPGIKNAYAVNHYKEVRDMDLSFISDADRYNQFSQQIQQRSTEERSKEKGYTWTPEREQDRIMDDLAKSVEQIAKTMKKVKGSRKSNSDEFNSIVDDFTDLQEKIRKGSTKENREELLNSLVKFSHDCKTYQDTHQGFRWTIQGSRRKTMVGDLQKLIDENLQKVMAPEMEKERQEIIQRENQKVNRELEQESMKQIKESFKEKVSFEKLSKEEGSKTSSHKPEKEHENTHAKEKESESRRKSMGAIKK